MREGRRCPDVLWTGTVLECKHLGEKKTPNLVNRRTNANASFAEKRNHAPYVNPCRARRVPIHRAAACPSFLRSKFRKVHGNRFLLSALCCRYSTGAACLLSRPFRRQLSSRLAVVRFTPTLAVLQTHQSNVLAKLVSNHPFFRDQQGRSPDWWTWAASLNATFVPVPKQKRVGNYLLFFTSFVFLPSVIPASESCCNGQRGSFLMGADPAGVFELSGVP